VEISVDRWTAKSGQVHACTQSAASLAEIFDLKYLFTAPCRVIQERGWHEWQVNAPLGFPELSTD
jgi:hypothetical protein